MKIQILNSTLHGILDYVAAAVLMVAPIVFSFSGPALILSIGGGAGLILYSLLTNYRFGAIRILSFDVHLVLDLAAGLAFIAAPIILHFDAFTSDYYFVMAGGVISVVALSDRANTSTAAQAS